MKRQLTAGEITDVLQKLEGYLSDLKARWDQENPGGRSWFKLAIPYITKSTEFIVSILDELILFVEGIIPEGSDKKAAVMTLIGKLFDYIVVQAFPIWLKPFTSTIKLVVVNILVSNLIDFIVGKYNAGFWNQKQEANNGEASKK